MRSIRVQLFSFIFITLLIMLILLNTYPLTSARDLVFQEKKSAMNAQSAVLAASLSSLDSLNQAGVEEVLRLLDVSGFERIVVADREGLVLYDSAGVAGHQTELEELQTALEGKTVFRSSVEEQAFSSASATPIGSQGALIGAVYLSERDTERAELILSMQSRIRVTSIVILAMAVTLAMLLVHVLLRRIKELVLSMRAVAAGDYSHRHVLSGKDEITELGEEFNLLTERLDETERQRRRFVSDASHELKTPLASIRLLADSVVQNDNMDRETVREFVSDIGSEARRLQRTAEELLDLSRLDDEVRFVPEPVAVAQIAQSVVSVLRPLAEEKQLRISCELDEDCVVMATTDNMYHILFNLTENAIKYNVPGGAVRVLLRQDDSTVTLTVEDTGIGIPPEDRVNVFSRFYRVDKARSREAGGSGLGLSIVHDAVLAHGGSVTVGPNLPQGSRFVVTFPRLHGEERAD